MGLLNETKECLHPSARNLDADGLRLVCRECGQEVPPDKYCGVCGINIPKGTSICNICQGGFR